MHMLGSIQRCTLWSKDLPLCRPHGKRWPVLMQHVLLVTNDIRCLIKLNTCLDSPQQCHFHSDTI